MNIKDKIPGTTDWYLKKLSHVDPAVQGNAIKVLTQRCEPRSLDPILKLSGYKGADVNAPAIRAALNELGVTQELLVMGYIYSLQSQDTEVRSAAIDFLAHSGDSRAIVPLRNLMINLLIAGNWSGHEELASALQKLGAKKELLIEGYIRASQSAHDMVRDWAIGSLGASGNPLAIWPLRELLRNSNTRNSALQAFEKLSFTLGESGDSRAVSPFLSLLWADDREVRETAAVVLGRLGDPRAVKPLISKLRTGDCTAVRQAAAVALGRLGDQQAIEAMMVVLGKEQNSDLLEALAESAVQLNEKKWEIEQLLPLLQDQSSGMRIYAITALGKSGDPMAVEPLLELLGDGRQAMRKSAAVALGRLGDSRAIQSLLARLGDESSEVRESARTALEKLGAGKDELVSGYIAALYSSASAQKSAIDHLIELRDRRAIPRLVYFLTMTVDYKERKLVAAALSELGVSNDELVAAYIAALDQWNPEVRVNAANFLGEHGDLRAVEPLLDLMREEDEGYVRHVVEEALERLAARKVDVIPGYIRAVQQGPNRVMLQGSKIEVSIRHEAVKVLGESGDLRAAGALLELWRDQEDDEDVRRLAREALGKLGVNAV